MQQYWWMDMRRDGRDGAREALENFWKRMSEYGLFSPLHQTPMDRAVEGWNLDSSKIYTIFDIFTRLFSPKQRNPLNFNPLKQLLEEMIDFKNINSHEQIKLFVAATCVQSGLQHIFNCENLDVDILLATACMPFMFQPVKVGKNYFWDGGYGGNPAMWPLIYNCKSSDIILVQINPFVREEIPQSGNEIVNRLNEITFNSCLLGELRAIRFVSKLIHQGSLKGYKDVHMHMINSPEALHDLNASSKVNVDWDFFIYLRDIGREMTDKWLKENFNKLGKNSTFNSDDVIPADPDYPKAA